MRHDSNYRQVAMWMDLNKVKHYETYFMIQTLADLINSDASTNASMSFRLFFNVYRNPKTIDFKRQTKEDNAANLYCSERFPEVCLDRETYGSRFSSNYASYLEPVVDEIVRQSLLFRNDPSLFKRYANEYTVSCLIDNGMLGNVTKCGDGVLKFLADISERDYSSQMLNNNSVVQRSVLAANLASIEKFSVDPSELQISVNNEFVKVGTPNNRASSLLRNFSRWCAAD